MPRPIPPSTPYPSQRIWMTPSLAPRLATIKPVPQRTAATMPDLLGPLRSTKRPITAADMPRKKIARLKVMATSLLAQPKAFSSGRLKTLQAYTEPIEIWIPTADAAMSHRFFIEPPWRTLDLAAATLLVETASLAGSGSRGASE